MTSCQKSPDETGYRNSNISRLVAIDKFINSYGIRNFKVKPLKADCSKRIYYRIFSLQDTFILMDASEDRSSIEPFINIGMNLLKRGFSVPKLYAQNIEEGLLLSEDLGDDSFTAYLKKNPDKEYELYEHAVEALSKLCNTPVDIDIPTYNETNFNTGLTSFLEWVVQHQLIQPAFEIAKKEFFEIFNNLFRNLSLLKPVFCHRDYMADNLFYLADRSQHEKVGILDFQDASFANPAYDLVSILEDARRDVSQNTAAHSYKSYLNGFAKLNANVFNICYITLSLQRNLGIIALFHRKHIKDGSPHYLSYLPRVWKFVRNSLQHPISRELKQWFDRYDIK
jgi:N-acetylmuramate 1-kinase